jgi:hypothetical protein
MFRSEDKTEVLPNKPKMSNIPKFIEHFKAYQSKNNRINIINKKKYLRSNWKHFRLLENLIIVIGDKKK